MNGIQKHPGSDDPSLQLKAVLITGCSSGIGKEMACYLSRHGFLIFATVRNPEGAQALRALNEPNLVPVSPLDLSRLDEVQLASEIVVSELRSRGLNGLYAIVNNAGGGVTAPLELLDMSLLEKELMVRVVGAAQLVQLLLPEIRKAAGRLLWITTPGLIPLAYKSSIHVAEFAAQGLARTFRIELAAWKIPSIMIACGGVRSNAISRMDRQLASSIQSWPKDQLALYAEQLKEVQERSKMIIQKGADPQIVAKVVERALKADRPRPIYRIGFSADLMALLGLLPGTWFDGLFTFTAQRAKGERV